jgi:hypothetical protein
MYARSYATSKSQLLQMPYYQTPDKEEKEYLYTNTLLHFPLMSSLLNGNNFD